jgi:hypothetical protein
LLLQVSFNSWLVEMFRLKGFNILHQGA